MKKSNQPLNLLPFYFRNIGLGIIALLLFLSFFVIIWDDFIYKATYKSLFEIILLVALLIIALSKDRIEDERSLQIRVKAFAGAFIFGVASFIIDKIFDIFEIVETTKELRGSQVMINMFFWYFFIHWLIERKG